MPRRPPPREPPPELDADMRPDDLVDELRRLKFNNNEFSAVKIDEQVRDYLIASLSRRVLRRA